MDGTGPQQPLTDSQLDRELESALGIEPSPEFLARVRTRVFVEPERSRWRRAVVIAGFSRAFQPTVAMALAAVLLAIVVSGLMRDGASRRPTATVTDRGSPERPLISDGSDIGGAAIRGTGRVGVTARVRTKAVFTSPRRRDNPEVLISQDDRRAFDALLIAVAENRLPVRATPVDEADRSLAIAPLQIQQLRIEPLQLTGLEGVNGS